MSTEELFEPVFWLKNQHLMTVMPVFWPRNLKGIKTKGIDRTFKIDETTKLVGRCHFQSADVNTPTLIIVHGLEGSSNSRYVLGMSAKAIKASMNVVRINLRNCGGTLHLTPTLYNAGQSNDIIAVVNELQNKDKLTNIFLVGYSLGGNIVLKAAAELGKQALVKFKAVCAISPPIDLKACLAEMDYGINKMYHLRFLMGLKLKVLQKSKLFVNKFDVSKLKLVKNLYSFDNYFTAPDAGYASADDYYEKASSLNILDKIEVPTIIIQAQDDPIIPFKSFLSPKLNNPAIKLVHSKYGGHGGFLHKNNEVSLNNVVFDRFWAENRVLNFCIQQYS